MEQISLIGTTFNYIYAYGSIFYLYTNAAHDI